MPRLYLDNAATSFPKAPGVFEAMQRYAADLGASAGRGSYAEAIETGRLIRRCRERLQRLINAEAPERIVFTLNTTDALNLAIKGAVLHRTLTAPRRRIHLVTSQMDHNSVLRPFNALREQGVEWSCVPADPATGHVDPADVRRAITADTLLVAISHASNVTGTIQPIDEIGRACRERDVLFLVDAAQSLGHVPLDVRAACVDLLAFPGHKGLLGPLGTGGLYLRPGVERAVRPLREGGTGSSSDLDTQPETLPDRYEAGSQNAIGIVGLSEAVAWILERGVERLREHELGVMARMIAGLRAFGRFDDEGEGGAGESPRVLGVSEPRRRVGVFSIVYPALAPAELAGVLEQRYGMLVRPGVHCAPRAHAALGTLRGDGAGGATRLSIGPFVTGEDAERVCAALGEVCRTAGQPPRLAHAGA